MFIYSLDYRTICQILLYLVILKSINFIMKNIIEYKTRLNYFSFQIIHIFLSNLNQLEN